MPWLDHECGTTILIVIQAPTVHYSSPCSPGSAQRPSFSCTLSECVMLEASFSGSGILGQHGGTRVETPKST